MGLTLDGIAKGHIADEASRFLIAEGLSNHLINAGGDIVAAGEKAPGRPWMVAVENPAARGGFVRRMPLRDRAVATSGSYEIYYDASRRHHHLINPAAGASPTDLVSATVTARTAVEADALATSLSVMAPRDGLRLIASLPAANACCSPATAALCVLPAGGPERLRALRSVTKSPLPAKGDFTSLTFSPRNRADAYKASARSSGGLCT